MAKMMLGITIAKIFAFELLARFRTDGLGARKE